MCNPMIAIAAAGYGLNHASQRAQQHEYNRAKQADDFYENQRLQQLIKQQNENNDFAARKNQEIVKEAEAVAPNQNRVDEIQRQTDTQTASNIRALQDLNAVGNDSVARFADGNHSDAYNLKRAETAANQTAQAINLARLFAAQSAPSAAMAQQRSNSLDHRLNQGLIDAQRNSANRGHNVIQESIANRRNRATRIDPTKGQAQQALGGAMMQYGLSGVGQQAGGYFGQQAGKKNILNNLF